MTDVICRAPHPLRHVAKFADRECHGLFIQEFGMRLSPVKNPDGTCKVVGSWEDVNYEAGEVPFPCWHDSCGMISIYHILPANPEDDPEVIEADAAAWRPKPIEARADAAA